MKKYLLFLLLCFSCLSFGQIKGVQVCAACHGEKGLSANAEWPHLAGQHQQYTLKQLHDIKADIVRHVPTMAVFLQSLSENELEDLATRYAKMTKPQGVTPRKYLQRGEQLYRGGDFAKHIPACIACHGPQGTGNAQAGFPLLSGQHALYTQKQLEAFKKGERKNDFNNIMQDISKKMSAEDMTAVAHYIEGLY